MVVKIYPSFSVSAPHVSESLVQCLRYAEEGKGQTVARRSRMDTRSLYSVSSNQLGEFRKDFEVHSPAPDFRPTAVDEDRSVRQRQSGDKSDPESLHSLSSRNVTDHRPRKAPRRSPLGTVHPPC